jgi:hypothetical protein
LRGGELRSAGMNKVTQPDHDDDPETGRIGEEGAAKKSNGIDEEGEGRVPLGDSPEHSKVPSGGSESANVVDGGSSQH